MERKRYFLAVVALLAIPAAWLLGGALANAIDPEIARGHADYARNFRLLADAKKFVIGAIFLLVLILWLASFTYLILAMRRSPRWSPLALLGPLGLTALALLGDRARGDENPYRRFVRGMGPLARVAYEIAACVAMWTLAFTLVEAWSEISIQLESAATGDPIPIVVERRDASGGMWAFSEGLEVLFLVALIYLLRPFGFNAAAALWRRLRSAPRE